MKKDPQNPKNYHPKNVSFEVESMLAEEQKHPESFENNGDYSLDKERSFNPLTDKDPAEKHIEYEHERNALHNPQELEQHKVESLWKKSAKMAASKVKQAFEAVIQSMLAKKIAVENMDIEPSHKPKSFLDVKKVDHAIHEKSSHIAHLNHSSAHPHVDAVLHEHQQNHDHGRSR
jgi:hypothetical protein